VGGSHYRAIIQHWDFALANNLDYFQGQITKYVIRWKEKGGIQDLEKAQHFLEKYIEWAQATMKVEEGGAGPNYVNQDNHQEIK
jgi:hypothetical protein